MSDVLNSDENIVNIALIAFCPLAVTKCGKLCGALLLFVAFVIVNAIIALF